MHITTDTNPALAAITITKEEELEHSVPPASNSITTFLLAFAVHDKTMN